MKKELKTFSVVQTSYTRKVIAAVICIVLTFSIYAFAAQPFYNVYVSDGDTVTRIVASSKDPKKALEDSGIEISENDFLDLSDFNSGDESYIKIYRGVKVFFTDMSGSTVSLICAGTVKSLLDKLGTTLSENQFTNYPLDTVLEEGMSVAITKSYTVTVIADGKSQTVKTKPGIVKDAVDAMGISLSENDETEPSLYSELYDNITISVNRVDYTTRTALEPVPFTIKSELSEDMYSGQTKVKQAGVNGEKNVTYRDKLVNGQVVSSTVYGSQITKAATPQINLVGNKKRSFSAAPSSVKAKGAPISELTPPADLTLDENGRPTKYSRVITGTASAYSERPGSSTASGRKVKVGYVAVNPKQIPYGTRLYIVANNGTVYGYAIAADTGGFVKWTGSRARVVDLFFNTNAECKAWGLRDVSIYVLD